MAIIVLGSVKGGVGKTTLAVNLAIGLAQRRKSVLLVDGDEQKTALNFMSLRCDREDADSLPFFTTVGLYGAGIRTQVRSLAPKVDFVIIDVGGRDSGSLRAALTVAGLVIIPAAPRSFDLWGCEQTAELVREAREVNDVRAVAVLNGADASGHDNTEALGALAGLDGVEVSPYRLGRRKAYPNAAAVGLGVLEYLDPSNRAGALKAREEFSQLLESLFPTKGKK